MKIANPLDMQNQQILNMLLQALSADPTPNVGNAGQVWFNTTTNLAKWSNGTAVIDPLARANHSGTQIASTISDFDTRVRTSRLDQMTAPTAPVAMGGQQVSGLGTAASAGQAVEYGQFQTALANIASGMDIKETQATAVATSNINIAAAPATLGGYTLLSGDSVLLTGQTTGSQNGLWTFNGSGAALTRRADASTAGSVLAGTMAVIGEHGDGSGGGGVGGANADTVWMQTAVGTGAAGAIILGTDSQTWIKPFNTTFYSAGNGISVTGAVIAAVVAASGGLTVGGSGLAVDTSVVARKSTGTIPSGTTSYTITHNLANATPTLVLRQAGAQILADNTATDANNITVTFAAATTVATTFTVIG